ncbi:unnamed protein product [Ilex paraguariensis]|uniref:DC1 domain-containing protein n=1 Tax=Ilex paraguariensis TaxID=185542 RepID=A0ABC8TQR2_9AQUA
MEEPKEELLSHHFSHEHELEHTNLPPKGNTKCFGCKLNILPGKYYYRCKTCRFYLHQVCYSMPTKVRHPADPGHHFTLQAMPSSAEPSFKCEACGHYVDGFYYSCARRGNYYHMLCLSMPLSVKTPSHPHTLKLEFSPPYDFQCDLCEKPSYKGWLYHCSLCEFDAHPACAITNKGAPMLQNHSVPQPNSLKTQNRIDSHSKYDELMELLTQGVKGMGDSIGQEVLQDQSQPTYQSTPCYEDLATPSHMLSEACFSIDFAKSILLDEDGGEARREVNDHEVNIQEFKETSHRYTMVSKWVSVNPKHAADEAPTLAKQPFFPLHSESLKNGLNKASSTGIGSHIWMEWGQENEKTKANGSRDKSDVTDQTTKSKMVRSRLSCWSVCLDF